MDKLNMAITALAVISASLSWDTSDTNSTQDEERVNLGSRVNLLKHRRCGGGTCTML